MTTAPGPLWQQELSDLEGRIASGDIVDRFPPDRAHVPLPIPRKDPTG